MIIYVRRAELLISRLLFRLYILGISDIDNPKISKYSYTKYGFVKE